MRPIGGVVLLLAVLGAFACAPVLIPAGPPVTAPVLEQNQIIAADGAALPVHVWLPQDGAPEAVVIALHGFNDYGRFFAAAGGFLAERGVASYAYDQRGFGGAPDHGMWPGTETLVADLGAAVEVIRERHPGIPLFLLGESMGGAVILVAMAGPDPPDVDGVILSAPAVWGRSTMPWYQTGALWFATHTMPWLKLSGRGIKITPSDNREMLQALGRDPLVIKETRIDAINGLTDLMSAALDAAPAVSVPALILYGDNDEIIPPLPIETMLRRLPADRHDIAFYPDGYHMLLRDLNGEIPQSDIAHWILEQGAPLPSGADLRGAERRMLLAEQPAE